MYGEIDVFHKEIQWLHPVPWRKFVTKTLCKYEFVSLFCNSFIFRVTRFRSQNLLTTLSNTSYTSVSKNVKFSHLLLLAWRRQFMLLFVHTEKCDVMLLVHKRGNLQANLVLSLLMEAKVFLFASQEVSKTR